MNEEIGMVYEAENGRRLRVSRNVIGTKSIWSASAGERLVPLRGALLIDDAGEPKSGDVLYVDEEEIAEMRLVAEWLPARDVQRRTP